MAFQNLLLFLDPIIFGVINDHTKNTRKGYYWPEIFLIIQIFIGILVSLILKYNDYKGRNILNKSIKKTEEID